MSTPVLYHQAIANALSNGYRVDTVHGIIYGLKGKPLRVANHGTQRYPTVTLAVRNMPRRLYAVPAHKVVAFAIWGDAAFAPGAQVRHIRGVLDISADALRLGTSSDNQLDKAPEIRKAAAVKARASQGRRPLNTVLTEDTVRYIRETCKIGPDGHALYGEVKKLCTLLGLGKSTISMALRGKTWNDLESQHAE